ncbi:MAG TPA: hypothetical protein VJ957_09130, partial [Longimicrobiales bacterium]|nr:hypothetical protein [Longimicrobiales bacterium]
MTLSDPQNPAAPSRFSRRHVLIAVALACVAMGVYANSVRNGFALDDEYIIAQNDTVHGIQEVPITLVSPYWPFGVRSSSLYRPLTLASYAIDWSLWDQNPHGFHV